MSGTPVTQTTAAEPAPGRRALIAGWFSFEYGSATAGDVLTGEVVRGWLEELGFPCDTAFVPPFKGDVDWRTVDPDDYTHVVFVCGPFNQGVYEAEFLTRFAGCRLIGLNLTLPVAPAEWNPFDLLIERDSPAGARPDMAFLSQRPLVPLIGVIMVEDYEGPQVRVPAANAAVNRLLDGTTGVRVPIDTRLDVNETGLRTQAEVESIIARMDAVVTTRLHGTVLALKNGVPPVVIDPEAGGAKLRRQAERLGWPLSFNVDGLTEAALRDALAYCLTPEARVRARECAAVATRDADAGIRAAFIAALVDPAVLERDYARRLAHGGETREGFAWAPRAVAETAGRADPSAMPGRVLRRVLDGARAIRDRAAATLPAPPHGRPPVGRVRFGDLRRTEPISREFGYDRGLPVDRYYIEAFLERHAADIRGRVLEVGGKEYTDQFGSSAVTRTDVLHVDAGNPVATIVADLAAAPHIPGDSFDCIILTQTLQLIFDLHGAVDTLHRILAPGGTLLATVPGLTQNDKEWARTWYWAFTDLSARRLLETRFPAVGVEVESWGNVLTSAAFLYGLAVEELRPAELEVRDPQYPMLITIRARKPQP